MLLGVSLSLIDVPFKVPDRDAGRLGTGGTEEPPLVDPNALFWPNKLPKPPGVRREGEAIVA